MTIPFLTSPAEGVWLSHGATIVQTAAGWRVPESFAGESTELRAAREAVALGDDTPRGKIRVQGDEADALIGAALGAPPAAVGRVVRVGTVEITRLRMDLCHVGMTAEDREAVWAALCETRGALPVTITDVTHGRFEFRLVGPAAPLLLSKVCGIDFHASVFADGQARETSVAKTRQLVIRADLGGLPAYRLLGGRALGAYMWETLMEAGRDLGVEAIGTGALLTLAG